MTTFQLPANFCPTKSLDNYIKWANKQANLSTHEEANLLSIFHDEKADATKKIEAAKHLIISHLKYVCFIARNYTNYGLPLADLIQEGNIGLMKALKRFDPSHKARLVTYAAHWIKAEIQDFIIKNIHMVKKITTKVKKKIWQMLPSSQPTHQEAQDIATELNVDIQQVYDMSSTVSTDTYLEEQLPDQQTKRIDMLASNNQDNPEHIVADDTQKKLRLIEASLALLDNRERDIVSQRWLNDKKTPLKTIAQTYNISIERTRQIEAAALKKIKTHINN